MPEYYTELNEKELPNNYPIYEDYLYVCDSKVIRSDILRGTILDLKENLRNHHKLEAKIITNCDIAGRRKQLELDEEYNKPA